jgi:hypothetical protein
LAAPIAVRDMRARGQRSLERLRESAERRWVAGCSGDFHLGSGTPMEMTNPQAQIQRPTLVSVTEAEVPEAPPAEPEAPPEEPGPDIPEPPVREPEEPVLA